MDKEDSKRQEQAGKEKLMISFALDVLLEGEKESVKIKPHYFHQAANEFHRTNETKKYNNKLRKGEISAIQHMVCIIGIDYKFAPLTYSLYLESTYGIKVLRCLNSREIILDNSMEYSKKRAPLNKSLTIPRRFNEKGDVYRYPIEPLLHTSALSHEIPSPHLLCRSAHIIEVEPSRVLVAWENNLNCLEWINRD
jgi:hypothetical protein